MLRARTSNFQPKPYSHPILEMTSFRERLLSQSSHYPLIKEYTLKFIGALILWLKVYSLIRYWDLWV